MSDTATIIETQMARLNISTEALRQHNERVQQVKDQRRAAIVSGLKFKWGAPVRQVNTAARREGEWGVCLQKLETLLSRQRGSMVALVGGRGNGKTQMAVELMRHTVKHMKPARFITAIGFFMEVKSTYRKDADKTEKQVLEEFCAPNLLVLDEISKRSDSNWENDLLFELLNRRYNDRKDTILIANLSASELQKFLGPSISSRMNESGGVVECHWPTFRER